MPLPIALIVGTALRGLAGESGQRVNPRDLVPQFTFKLSRGGRGIRKAGQRIKRRTERSARRAVTAIGKRVGDEITAIVADKTTSSVVAGKRTIRRQAPRPGDKRPVYTVRIVRSVDLKSIKGRKTFEPYPGRRRSGPKRGRLTIRQLSGQVVVFEGVEQARGRFKLPASGGHKARGVGGLRVRVDSTPEIARLRRTVRKRVRAALRVEFSRQGRRR